MTHPAAPVPSATVLLVDDEAPIRRSLGPYLERGGYRVLLASDGMEALDILASYQVDIIVSDVLMPRMDGRELVRRVRAGGAWTPIILLTQVDASYERVSALDDGADDYLSKPFDPAELASRIRAVLRRTRGVAQPLTSAARLTAGQLILERTSRRVTLSGREVTLTPKATMLLDYLMSHPGELHTRDDAPSTTASARSARPWATTPPTPPTSRRSPPSATASGPRSGHEPLADAASAAALGPAASGARAGRPYPLHGAGGGYGRAEHHAGHLAHCAGWAVGAG